MRLWVVEVKSGDMWFPLHSPFLTNYCDKKTQAISSKGVAKGIYKNMKFRVSEYVRKEK